MERAPQPRQLIKKRVNLTQDEKEAAVLALVTRSTSKQSIDDQLGVSRKSLYNYKERRLGKTCSVGSMTQRKQMLIK